MLHDPSAVHVQARSKIYTPGFRSTNGVVLLIIILYCALTGTTHWTSIPRAKLQLLAAVNDVTFMAHRRRRRESRCFRRFTKIESNNSYRSVFCAIAPFESFSTLFCWPLVLFLTVSPERTTRTCLTVFFFFDRFLTTITFTALCVRLHCLLFIWLKHSDRCLSNMNNYFNYKLESKTIEINNTLVLR